MHTQHMRLRSYAMVSVLIIHLLIDQKWKSPLQLASSITSLY